MATWEDGPEYAPIERPEGFSVPDQPPLDVAPPARPMISEPPQQRPQFADPQAPVAPLASLAPAVEETRDPAVPFEVAASTVTASSSAWGAAHWSGPAGSTAPAAGQWGPPSSTAWPAPATPIPAPPAPGGGAFPAAGTPQWFGPGPASYPAPVANPTAKSVFEGLTAGVIITLGVGAIIYPTAPFTLCLAFALSTRVKVAKTLVMRVFVGALAALAFFAVLGGLFSSDSLSDWYGFIQGWALLISWILVVILPILVYRELKKSPLRRPPPYSSNWG